MQYRNLGRTGIKVSPYALGTMMFGAIGNPDHEDSIKIIHKALDAGVNVVDTADFYSNGESEEILGKALKGRRDDVILATKFHLPMGEDPNMRGNSRRWITTSSRSTGMVSCLCSVTTSLRTSTSPFFTRRLSVRSCSSFSSIFCPAALAAALVPTAAAGAVVAEREVRLLRAVAAVAAELALLYPPCRWMIASASSCRFPASTVTRNRPALTSFS